MSPQFLDLSQELILQVVDFLPDEEKDIDASESDDETFAKLKLDHEAAEADGGSKRNGQEDDGQEDDGQEADGEEDDGEEDDSEEEDSQEEDTRTDEATDDASNKHSAQNLESQHNDGDQALEVVSSGEQDIYNLIRTCTSFYKILTPYLFRSITLRNTRKSGAAVLYLCSTSQISCVKTLHFKGTAPGENNEDFRDVDRVFPPEVKTVLTNLSQFPRLKTLIVDFDFHLNEEEGLEHWDDVLSYLTVDDEDETVEDVERAEEQEGWRALAKKTFEAICMNASNGTRELVVKDCPIRANSVLGSNRFNKVRGIIHSIP